MQAPPYIFFHQIDIIDIKNIVLNRYPSLIW